MNFIKISTYSVGSFRDWAFLSYQLHKVWKTDMTFDLDRWPTDLNINCDHLLVKGYLPTKCEASGAKRSWVYHLHKVYSRRTWPLTLTSDLLTWLSIGIIYIKDYLPTKFEACGAKHSWVISCTRCRRPTDMCKSICRSLFKEGHKKAFVPYLPCLCKRWP